MSDHASMIVLPSLLASVRKAATHIKLEVSAFGLRLLLRDSPMNLLTNGFVNNYGRLFGPSEQFEADIVELGLKRLREKPALSPAGTSESQSCPKVAQDVVLDLECTIE
jgi:hypothetical protein